MRRSVVPGFMFVLAATLVALTGCNAGTSSAPKTDYGVKVTVTPASATIPVSGGEVNVTFTIANEGEKSDTYALEAGDDFFGKKIIGDKVPADVELAPGESKQLELPVKFEGAGSMSADFEIAVRATSEGDPKVSDRASCKVTIK